MKVYRAYESRYPHYGCECRGLWVAVDRSYCEDAIMAGETADALVEFDFDFKAASVASADDLSEFLVDEDGQPIDDPFDCEDVILNLYDDRFYVDQAVRAGYDVLTYYNDEDGDLYFVMDESLLSNPKILISGNSKQAPVTSSS